jgi:hypothetical protein
LSSPPPGTNRHNLPTFLKEAIAQSSFSLTALLSRDTVRRELAKGGAEAGLTQEAKAALKRLEGRKTSAP